MALKITNTLSGQKEVFLPLSPGQVRMYACGVTVYDYCHVGHARALITFDVIYRYLKFLGYEVTFVRNFTDVDDKIIQRAGTEGVTADAVAEKFINAFHSDAEALGLLAPTHEPRATEHIAEMIRVIEKLEDHRNAYRVNGDVYFSVESFGDYGKLSRRTLAEMEAGARIEVDSRKKHPMDFALWKASKKGEPSWESPWGLGRPGWHIECSAMSTKYLGQPFDIHGGGQDLVFPHNENEIAQSECASHLPLARYWIHNGFVQLNKEKMSKSLGNILSIKQVLEKVDPATLRYYMLGSHYRTPIEFSEAGIFEGEKALERLHETLVRLGSEEDRKRGAPDESLLNEFRQEMDDDFNTPRALALIFEEVRAINRLLDRGEMEAAVSRKAALTVMGETLGLLQGSPDAFLHKKKERGLALEGLSADVVEDMVHQRDQARKEKNWAEADRIRNELRARGIVLEDTPGGTSWKVA